MKRTVRSLHYIGSAFEEFSKALTGTSTAVPSTVKPFVEDRRLSKLQIRAAVDETLLKV